jgi:hypothetical protein
MSVPGGVAIGASASPASAGALPTKDSLAGIQAWLDADFITPDAPPGGTLQAGITFWDTGQLTITPIDGVYGRLKPAKGKAAPSEGKVTADFAGHVLIDLAVPTGGPGALVVGVHGSGGNIPLRIAGTGPPPGALPFQLITGTVHDIVGDVVAGRPFPVTVDVMPRGLWDVHAVGLTDRIDVVAFKQADPSGAEFGTATLVRQGDAGTPYTGTMTVRATGDLELAVAWAGGGAVLVIAGDRKPVTVLEAGVRPSTAPAASEQAAPVPAGPEPAAPGDGIPLIVWLVVIAIVMIGGGYLVLRFLADQ